MLVSCFINIYDKMRGRDTVMYRTSDERECTVLSSATRVQSDIPAPQGFNCISGFCMDGADFGNRGIDKYLDLVAKHADEALIKGCALLRVWR